MSLRQILSATRAEFSSRDIPGVDAELLAAHVLGISRMQLHAQEYTFTEDQSLEFSSLVAARIEGTPLYYLTGSAPFRYLTFNVGPGVLIPRPETELLVDAALVEIERIQSDFSYKSGTPTSVVDLGSGSGAIAISIADEAQKRALRTHVVAVEKEPAALTWLERNIALHESDVRVIRDDVSNALIGVKCDIVIANPPYIPDGAALPVDVMQEPASALFGGASGVEVPFRFITAATRILKSGGLLIMEHHESQSKELEAFMAEDYREIVHHRDLNERPRWITARRR